MYAFLRVNLHSAYLVYARTETMNWMRNVQVQVVTGRRSLTSEHVIGYVTLCT